MGNQPIRDGGKHPLPPKKNRSMMLPPNNKMKSCAGVDVAELSNELKKKPALGKTRRWAGNNQAQSVEQQRKTRTCERERIARFRWHLGFGGRQHEHAAPSCETYLVQIKSQTGYAVLVHGCCSRGNNKKNIPTNGHRQSAACCYIALRRDRDLDGAARTSVEGRLTSTSSSRASCCCVFSWA